MANLSQIYVSWGYATQYMNISSQISKLEAKIRKQQEFIDRQEEQLIQLKRTLTDKVEKLHFQSLSTKITREAYDKYFVNADDMHLLTLTFDPEVLTTFNLHNTELQANYIYSKIEQFHRNLESNDSKVFIYGCMEFHKSGILHTHFLVKYNSPIREHYQHFSECIFNDLKMKFTFKAYNKICVDWQAVKKFYESCDYIEKEPYLLFKFGKYSLSVLDT